uniref:Uncharacterized protein n=1 Tax=Solanum tuberosum TaxID=4113 RepID=M1DWJ3_SOLTU
MAIDICADHPSAFWNRKKHIVTLPYEDDFSEENIPTKSRPCQMNTKLVEFCKKEIDNLLQNGLIKPSKSPWSCTAFYVNNAAEKEKQTIRLLNKRDIELYKSQYKFLHIGMTQIAFKSLTLKGLPETFLAALRDARNLNFRQSLMGSIESTVTDLQ